MALLTEFHFPTVLIYLVPAFIFSVTLYLSRWLRREHTEIRARSWPAAQAKVHNSFELNERSKKVGNEYSSEEYIDIWAPAIQYSYQVNGEFYAGTYFLPQVYKDSGKATVAGRVWIGETIIIRYDPKDPEKSFFLQSDGAPGKPHIPRSLADRPQVTTLSLK